MKTGTLVTLTQHPSPAVKTVAVHISRAQVSGPLEAGPPVHEGSIRALGGEDINPIACHGRFTTKSRHQARWTTTE